MQKLVKMLSIIVVIVTIYLPSFALSQEPVSWITSRYQASAEATEMQYDSLHNQTTLTNKFDAYGDITPGSAKMNYTNGNGGYVLATSESGGNYIKLNTIAYEGTPFQEMFAGAAATFGGTFFGNGKSLKVTCKSVPKAIVNLTVWDKTALQTISNVSFVNKKTVVVKIPESHEIEASIDAQIFSDSFNSVPPACVECTNPEGVIKNNLYVQYDFSMVGADEKIDY